MLETRGKRLAAGAGLLSGAVLTTTLLFVYQESRFRLVAPVAGLLDATITYYVLSKNVE
ncbi:hypothetical protein [Halorientalis regularis]|jgi:hypothetical protein|uniref:Uncharacterized protein n=1 Tax=Halorientalis regularis TaxID=660518 RepID=A0A1G7QQZ3_9EURY|nr:hypothetical protein [Halorientalis regularis]SDG00957.1 hypothetical protein SAMN05216218_11361 [Halorientalis regularis]